MSPRFGSFAPGPESLCVFFATRGFLPHCKSFAGVYMSVGSDLFSSHFFPCLSHLRFFFPLLVVPPLSLTPHVTLAQRLSSWTERLLNSLTAQFVNAAPGYFRPLGLRSRKRPCCPVYGSNREKDSCELQLWKPRTSRQHTPPARRVRTQETKLQRSENRLYLHPQFT